jgi:mRNA-degrading endonuclease RelE of RelBE toxin-antitoxin system
LKSRVTASFRGKLRTLAKSVQKRAKSAYRQFVADPNHTSLNFKKLPPHKDLWSVRITDDYRAAGWRTGDTIVWFFIGTHAEYDQLLRQRP